MKRKAFFTSAFIVVFLAGFFAGGIFSPQLPAGAEAAGSCSDIEALRVIFWEEMDDLEGVCRLELEAPSGCIAVDRKGERLPYHPYVMVKRK